MRLIGLDDLECLAIGATILGSGGGGDPSYDLNIAKQHVKEFGETLLLDLQEVNDDDWIAPVAFMGAPSVTTEKIPSGLEFETLLSFIEDTVGKKISHVIPIEVGGANALVPFTFAKKLGLSVIDTDIIGRAFPELQMCTCNLLEISPSSTFVVDVFGTSVMIGPTPDVKKIERICRTLCVEMGSTAALSYYLMSGRDLKKAGIPNSLSKAIELGKAMQQPNAMEFFVNSSNGKILGSGMVTDIKHKIDYGFLKGRTMIQPRHKGEHPFFLYYQNEYLVAYKGEKLIASTPDIIMTLDEDTLFPLTSESLVYGQRVVLIQLPSPEIWKTEKGLQLTGLEYFGI